MINSTIVRPEQWKIRGTALKAWTYWKHRMILRHLIVTMEYDGLNRLLLKSVETPDESYRMGAIYFCVT
ncbi:MAG: hypothetical protein HPY74_09895 [Firmicutes bacterium]|nr:hypothetical protein [Bacillota bacterium]